MLTCNYILFSVYYSYMKEDIKYSYIDDKVRVLDEAGDVIILDKGVGVAREPMIPYKKKRVIKKKKYIKKKERIANLTEKQKKFIGKVAQGYPLNRAAFEAYDAKSLASASGIAATNLKNPTIREMVLQVLDKKGINLESALEPLVKSLKAKKSIIQEGELVTTNIDDLDLQLKASDRALKLMGVTYKEQEPGGTNNYVQINNIHKSQYDDEE
jgi:hypothetical protein